MASFLTIWFRNLVTSIVKMKFNVIFLVGCYIVGILATPEENLARGNLQFTAKLYREVLKKNPNKNFVFSPFSVQTVLAALASAAANYNSETVTQIKTSVGLPNDQRDTESAFKDIISRFKANDDFKLFDANKMYLASHYNIENWYKNVCKTVYNMELEHINFGNTQAAANAISNWVSQQTDNSINNFISSSDISGNTKNLLVNALYLKGKWNKPFDPKQKVRRKFYGGSSTREVTMMTDIRSY